MVRRYKEEYKLLAERLYENGIDVEWVREKLKSFKVETPSWAYADSGTRFGVFYQAGAAVTIYEKLEDAAQVHKLTGIAPSVAVHVLWDFPDGKVEGVKEYAQELGLSIGAVNPNVFQDQCYKFGSIANPDANIRKRAIQHILDSIEIAKKVGSKTLSLWFADGTNHPGQDDFRRRKQRMTECLIEISRALPEDMTMLIEYKFFEPAFYHTDIADWGMAYVLSQKCGEKAKVLVDLGHHPQGTNIEHIVAFLIDEGKLGGFHFNNRKYADDDLTAGSINPYELFLIFKELIAAEEEGMSFAYMIDQAANIKPKIEEMIQTVVNIHTAYAKALLIPRGKLMEAQDKCDVVMAEQILQEAFNTDVTPLLMVVREEMGVPLDPITAYRESGYQQKIERERGIRRGAGGLGA
jgi:L-rhamnose isomerase/sugar isomerase